MRAFLALALALSSIPSYAKQPLNIEITPLIGYRFGGDFNTSQEEVHHRVELSEEVSYGLLTGWSLDQGRTGEFLVSHYSSTFSHSDDFSASNTGLAITYAHLGGTVPITDGYVPLHVSGGFGLSHLNPEDSALDSETRFSMSLGLGSTIPLTDHLSFRLDGRLYGTFFDSASSVFCDDAACAIYISSDLWIQSEVSAGLTFRF